MPNFSSIAAYAAQMDKVAKELNTEARRKITRSAAEDAQKIADRMAMRDVGSDRAFSGWRRGNRIPLDTKIKDGRDGASILMPERRTAGPWTVAEKGRNQGGTSAVLGPGINQRTGETARNEDGSIRKVRARKARRWNGRTSGKSTASDAIDLMERELPKVFDKQFGMVLQKHFDVS